MRLTPEHVARVARAVEDPGADAFPGAVWSTDADHDATVREILAARPESGDVWIFAYGSLIWKPGCDFVEQRTGLARGWHRAFCLGWDRRYRGTQEHPGLMMALDRGGECRGIVQKLPQDAVEANLGKLFRREMLIKPSAFPPRWLSISTDAGPVRAIGFAMNRKSGAYVGGLSLDQIADALAVAVGHWGSMADYLYSTVTHLEELGLHDGHLWRLQEMVAERIETATAAEGRLSSK